MAGKRTHVAKITEIERLMKLGLTSRAIARALGVSRNTVKAVREMEFGQPTESLEISADPSDAKWTELVQWNEIQRSVLSGVSLQVLWTEQVEDGGARPVSSLLETIRETLSREQNLDESGL